MNRFVVRDSIIYNKETFHGQSSQVSFAFVAVAMGAPSHLTSSGLLAGTYGAGALVSAPVASAPAVVGQSTHSYAAGPPVVENRVEYGVVGQRTVQTGHASVVAGHQYVVAGQETIPQPATSYVAGAPQNIVETRPIAPPAIPAAPGKPSLPSPLSNSVIMISSLRRHPPRTCPCRPCSR